MYDNRSFYYNFRIHGTFRKKAERRNIRGLQETDGIFGNGKLSNSFQGERIKLEEFLPYFLTLIKPNNRTTDSPVRFIL